jgi:hypothetical protein
MVARDKASDSASTRIERAQPAHAAPALQMGIAKPFGECRRVDQRRLPRHQFRQAMTRKTPDKRLCPPHMPRVKGEVNVLSMEKFRVTLPEQAVTCGALVIRHDDTPFFIHERGNEVVLENDWPVEPRQGAIPNQPDKPLGARTIKRKTP